MSFVAESGSENCLPIGTRLSDFEITGVLGEGGFGIVYIAFDHALQRDVAIKEYMPGVLAERGHDQRVSVRAERHQETFNIGLKSFINEARFLAQFDHPSLVKVHRFWEQNQTAYTAMQYYEGRTIKDIVAASPATVTEQWCLRVMQQILDGLDLLYTMHLLHRDISPDNIIVQDSGEAVLLDFGSARQIIGDRTRGMTVILKPGYAPIEQYTGDASLEQGPYTDISALAAVMYFAIVKEPPATSIARMVKDPMVPLAQRGLDGYSTQFLGALDKGLQVLAENRPQTIAEFRTLLGVEAGAAPRARASTNTQRFATIDRLPETPSAEADPDADAAAAPSGGAGAAAAGPATGAAADSSWELVTVVAEASRFDEPALKAVLARRLPPRWVLGALGATLGIAVLALGLNAALGPPSDTIMVAPGAQVALPEAASAPLPAPPLPVAAEPEPASVAELPALDVPVPAPAEAVVPPEDVAVIPAAAVKVETATYRLAIKPWGTVYVDGKSRGVTPPMKRLVLPVGKHKIRVVNPGFPDYEVEVNLTKNKSAVIEHDFAPSTLH